MDTSYRRDEGTKDAMDDIYVLDKTIDDHYSTLLGKMESFSVSQEKMLQDLKEEIFKLKKQADLTAGRIGDSLNLIEVLNSEIEDEKLKMIRQNIEESAIKRVVDMKRPQTDDLMLEERRAEFQAKKQTLQERERILLKMQEDIIVGRVDRARRRAVEARRERKARHDGSHIAVRGYRAIHGRRHQPHPRRTERYQQ